ncbi:CoxG family protein [Amycolatopsis sp. NPDC003865]
MATKKVDWSKRTAKKTAGTTVELDDTITVPVTSEVAWSRLEDTPLVASCLPGLDPASLQEDGPNAFRARMTHSVMGISANWDLRATLAPDPARRALRVVIDGEDSRLNMKLGGVADVSVRSGESGDAQLDYTANLRVDGSLAAMGGPVIRSILADAISQFVAVIGGEHNGRRKPSRRLLGRLRLWWARLTRKTAPTTTRTR